MFSTTNSKHLIVRSFNKYSWNTFNGPCTVLDTYDTEMSKTKDLIQLMKTHSKQVNITSMSDSALKKNKAG